MIPAHIQKKVPISIRHTDKSAHFWNHSHVLQEMLNIMVVVQV